MYIVASTYDQVRFLVLQLDLSGCYHRIYSMTTHSVVPCKGGSLQTPRLAALPPEYLDGCEFFFILLMGLLRMF